MVKVSLAGTAFVTPSRLALRSRFEVTTSVTPSASLRFLFVLRPVCDTDWAAPASLSSASTSGTCSRIHRSLTLDLVVFVFAIRYVRTACAKFSNDDFDSGEILGHSLLRLAWSGPSLKPEDAAAADD